MLPWQRRRYREAVACTWIFTYLEWLEYDQMNKNDTFTKKLTRYSVLVRPYFSLDVIKSEGQVIYHDFDPDVSYMDSTIFLDLNNDSVFDFLFKKIKQEGFTDCIEYWTTYYVVKPLESNSVAIDTNYALVLQPGK
jgi:hypothetical protein